jgi:hypothetical protein
VESGVQETPGPPLVLKTYCESWCGGDRQEPETPFYTPWAMHLALAGLPLKAS